MNKSGKKGQLELSFGMIFSIILIVVFIVFAGYAVLKIIGLQENVTTKKFVNDFQNDINKMWQANTAGSRAYTYNLPEKIEQICIDKESRISFYPLGSSDGNDDVKIENLNVPKKFCIESTGEIKTRISKGDDGLVNIEEETE